MRCGYTVVPHDLKFGGTELNGMWARRQATKFNGVSYITQRAAEAVYSDEGKKQIKEIIEYYRKMQRLYITDFATAALPFTARWIHRMYGSKLPTI